jgi:hypothetical protein
MVQHLSSPVHPLVGSVHGRGCVLGYLWCFTEGLYRVLLSGPGERLADLVGQLPRIDWSGSTIF